MDQTEIGGLTTIDYKEPTWKSTTLLCDTAIEITNAKTYVFADWVLWVGSISDQPVEAWKNKIKWYLELAISKIWIELIESQWNSSGNIPRIPYNGHPRRDSKIYDWITVWAWAVRRKDHLHVNVQWHYMGEQGNTEKCETNSVTVANSARRFPLGRWSFLELGSEKKWYGTYSDKPDGKWDKTAERMMLNFAESGHPIFRATSALERGELRSKESERSLFTSTVVKKPLNWFFARLFL